MNSPIFLFFLLVLNIAAVYVIDTVREERIVPRLADGFTGFVIEYVAMSVGLLTVGHYAVVRSLLAVTAINIVLFVLLFAVPRKMPELRTRKVGIDTVSGIIVIIGAAICSYRAGITMTSFHQDYYLYHGMSLMNYGIDDSLATSCGNIDFYYGLPGYPSVLAISGAIGGIKAILNIHLMMSLALGIYVSMIADRMKLSGITKYASIGIIMFSPVMISAGKAASCSLMICLLTTFAVKEMLDFIFESNIRKDNRSSSRLDPHMCILPAFGAVSALILITAKTLFFLPLIIAVFCMVYAYSDRFVALLCGAGSALVQLLVVLVALRKFPNVFNHEWWSWMSAADLDDSYGERAAIVMAVAWLVIALVMLLPAGRRSAKSVFADNNYIKGVALFAAAVAVIALCKMYYIYSKKGQSKIFLESTLAISLATGVFVIPGALLYLLVRKRKLPVPPYLAIPATIAVYGLFMICDSEIPYINSIGLEEAPVLPFMTMAVLLAGFAVRELDIRFKKQAIIYGAAAVMMLPMSLFTVCFRPETSMDMDDLEDIIQVTERGHNAIYIDESAQPLQFAIRLTCHSDVYLEGQTIPEGYDNIYVLTFEDEAPGVTIMSMTPANCDISVNGAPIEDIGGYYPIIGLKRPGDGRTLYLRITTISEVNNT